MSDTIEVKMMQKMGVDYQELSAWVDEKDREGWTMLTPIESLVIGGIAVGYSVTVIRSDRKKP